MKGRFTKHEAGLVRQAGEKKRQVTIRNLIANIRAKTGVDPTEAEIASLLATSVGRVRHHLNSNGR
jgi:hypothetical protein